MEQGLALLIMTKDFNDQDNNDEEVLQLDNFCEELKVEAQVLQTFSKAIEMIQN